MKTIDLYFDVSSPWTYLGYSRLHPLAARQGAEIVYHPILVGGVFNAVNQEVYEARANPHPVKKPYYDKDLKDWASLAGIEMVQPSVFPVRSVEALRGIIAAGEKGQLRAYATACFSAYWGEDQDISQPQVLDEIAREVGLDPEWIAERRKSQDIKDRLRANTDELIARGGFGSPTMFIGDDMYFGNDRLELVEAALERAGSS